MRTADGLYRIETLRGDDTLNGFDIAFDEEEAFYRAAQIELRLQDQMHYGWEVLLYEPVDHSGARRLLLRRVIE